MRRMLDDFFREERVKGAPPPKKENDPLRVAREDITDRVLQHELAQLANISAER